jgi:23S rRNA pseudouridine2605 synthase
VPPRHAYWTIIVDDQPTSFRAHDVEELLPTFNRLREKHPNAQLKWFERGQLFDTRDAAREQGFGQGERRWEGPRPDRDDERDAHTHRTAPRAPRAPGAPAAPRDKTWRPGGEHRDPRQKYKDAKKAKWDRYKQNLRTRWDEKRPAPPKPEDLPPPEPDHGDHTPPHGDPIRPQLKSPRTGPERAPASRRNLGAPAAMRNDRESRGDRPRDDRPRDDRPREFRRDDDRRGGWKPKGPPRDRDDRPREFKREDDRRGEWKPKGPPRGDRKPWSGKPGGKPGGARKPWGAKPASGARKPWGAKPAGAARKPWGSKPGGGFRKKPFGSGPPRGSRPPKKRRDDDE